MVEEKRFVMKYIRTYETEEKFLTDKDSTSRGFRLKPTLYKYSDVDNGIYLELDDPRKHGDSTYMEITLDSDTNYPFSFYICNKSGDNQTTMTCTIDWGDGTVETKTIDGEELGYNSGPEYNPVTVMGFRLSHNYKAGSHKIELYNVERDYRIIGHDDGFYLRSLISHHESVKRIVLGERVVSIDYGAFASCSSLTSINIPEKVTSIGLEVFRGCNSLTSFYIPEGVTSIEGGAFIDCQSLASVYIPEGVTSIGDSAFALCTPLTSTCIPKSVTSMGYGVFRDTSLIMISSLNTTAPTLGNDVFTNLPTNGTLHIKQGATGYDAWLSKLPSGWTIVEDL